MADEQNQGQEQNQQQGQEGAGGQPPARPEGLPDQFWDATANAVKLPDLLKEFGAADAFRKTETERLSKRPEAADKYELKLPETMKLPDGVTFEIDPASPLAAEFRAVAHAAGLDQPTMEKLIGLYADEQLGLSERHVKAEEERVRGEVAKLGEHSQARIDAVKAYLGGKYSKDEAAALLGAGTTAAGIIALEKLIEASGGPKLATGPASSEPVPTQDELKALMTTPEYQRGDPATVKKVRDGFARAYPGDARRRVA